MQTGPNTSTLIDGWLESGRGSQTALITAEDVAWTAHELYRSVCSVAAHLADLGIGRQDRLLMVMDDTPAFPAVFLGAMRIGAVPVPVNFLSRPDDFGYFLDDSAAVAAVVDHSFLGVVGPYADARPGVRLLVANGQAPDGALSLDSWLRVDVGELDPVPTSDEDMAFWLYSSGSTGRPKGVVHGHSDIAATCTDYFDPIVGVRPGEVCFSSTKMFHAYGLGNGLSAPLWSFATAVYLRGRPEPNALFERISTHRPSVLYSVPALYNAMLGSTAFDGIDWPCVRVAVSAAEPLPPEVWHRFADRTGIEILDGIGSTEMLHIYCSNRPGEVRPGTTGRTVGSYEVEIKDEDGQLCQPGQAGEMWVKGPSTLSEYWNQPRRTAEKLRDGWFLTGDRYRRDPDGFYVYEGRVDDMMKIGGLWVSPIEIENRLMEHASVREAAVVATEMDGRSRIRAAVILAEGADPAEGLVEDLQQWCKATLQRYEYPHVVDFVDDFPRTATGKIQRFKLR